MAVRESGKGAGGHGRARPRGLWCTIAALIAAACLGRGYPEVARVHAQVLASMAGKACDAIAAGHVPAARGITELQYPADRARQFLRQFDGQNARPSWRRLAELADAYGALVRDLDRARVRGEAWLELRRRAPAICERIRAQAEEVMAALEAEG